MGMRNYLIFGGVNSADYDVYITGSGVYNAPKRAVENIVVPGRNGLLTIDQGRYENITVEYPAFAFGKTRKEFQQKITAFRNAIMSQIGYQRLEDTYHPDEYRMALYAEGLNVDVKPYGSSGKFTLSFNCKPQRFLRDGEHTVAKANGEKIINPTPYESSPMLEVEGYGTIAFNGYEIELSSGDLGDVALAYSGTFLPPTGRTSYEYHIPINDSPLDVGDIFSMSLPYVRWHAYLKGWVYDYPFTGNSVTDTNSSATTSFDAGQQLPDRQYDTAGGAWHANYTYKTVVGTINFEKGTAKTWTNTATTASTPVATKVGSTITRKNITLSFVTTVSYDGENSEIVINLAISRSDTSVPLETQAYLLLETKYSDVVGYSTISQLGDPTYIDCDLGEAYLIKDGVPISLNQYIDLGTDLPKLASGENEITFDDTVTDLKITPRWWKI